MGIFNKLFGKQSNTQNKSLSIVSNEIATSSPLMTVHPDFRNYIWVGDGKYKNYTPSQSGINSVSANGYRITISFSFDEEPSLIYTSLPIAFNGKNIERPPYYPTYKNLTPEQKGVYWQFLENPYDSSFDIGYVFILYYGLERFLLTNQYEKVIDLIIALRDVHTNKSFQYYTANAIILSCLHYQRPDIVLKFMNSLDKDHESDFSNDLFLLCKHELTLPLSSKDIMRMAKSFEFKKNTYIKQYPDLFNNALTEIIRDRYGDTTVLCNRLISDQEFRSLPQSQLQVFANVSIMDKVVAIPTMTAGVSFKQTVFELLDSAHETVKTQLAYMRKSGSVEVVPVKKEATSAKEKIVFFDADKEAELLKIYNSKTPNSLDQHFASIDLQNFYYGFRDLGSEYLDKCIFYCLDDISRLPEIQASYRKDERYARLGAFNGRIPAYERLAIIYEKQKDYDKAIDICDKACQYYGAIGILEHRDGFIKREQKLIEKRAKSIKKEL